MGYSVEPNGSMAYKRLGRESNARLRFVDTLPLSGGEIHGLAVGVRATAIGTEGRPAIMGHRPMMDWTD